MKKQSHRAGLHIRILRLVRVLRIVRLTRYSKGLQILTKALIESSKELAMLVMFLSIGVVLFGTLIYYTETGSNDTQFSSVPAAFWWAIITSMKYYD